MKVYVCTVSEALLPPGDLEWPRPAFGARDKMALDSFRIKLEAGGGSSRAGVVCISRLQYSRRPLPLIDHARVDDCPTERLLCECLLTVTSGRTQCGDEQARRTNIPWTKERGCVGLGVCAALTCTPGDGVTLASHSIFRGLLGRRHNASPGRRLGGGA